nr:FadR family transcriptional regulator [Desulfobacterales bacterium]
IGLASGNILHVLMINFFEAFFYYFGNLYFGNARHRRHSEKFHRDIYDAIAKQDAGQAREIMHAVLRYAEQALFVEIEKSRQAPPTRG